MKYGSEALGFSQIARLHAAIAASPLSALHSCSVSARAAVSPAHSAIIDRQAFRAIISVSAIQPPNSL